MICVCGHSDDLHKDELTNDSCTICECAGFEEDIDMNELEME